VIVVLLRVGTIPGQTSLKRPEQTLIGTVGCWNVAHVTGSWDSRLIY
jgi:hypothetical protein